MHIKITPQTSIDWSAKGHERIVQNVCNLLSLYRYEVAYNRTLGMDPQLIDLPQSILSARYAAEVVRLIESGEPRAKVINVEMKGASADGLINYEVVIDIVS